MQAPLLTGVVGTSAICIPLWQRGRVCPLTHTGFCMDVFLRVLIALFFSPVFRFLFMWDRLGDYSVHFVLAGTDMK